MSEERKPVWCKCPQCGLIVQCMDTVPKDGDDWPAGRACSRCLCGEMVSLWPGTPAQPDASRQLLRDQFAAAALAGLMASGVREDAAERAYIAADKMIAIRDGSKNYKVTETQ